MSHSNVHSIIAAANPNKMAVPSSIYTKNCDGFCPIRRCCMSLIPAGSPCLILHTPAPTKCYMYSQYHITPNANMPIPKWAYNVPTRFWKCNQRKHTWAPGQSSHRVVVVSYSSGSAAMFSGELIIYRRHPRGLAGSASRCRYRFRFRSYPRALVVWAAVLAASGFSCHLGPRSTSPSGAHPPSRLSRHFRLAPSAGCQ